MFDTTLLTLAIFAILFLSVWYIWNVIFFKSWRRLFFMFLGVFLESTKRVDEKMEIEPSTRIPKSDEMKAQAKALDFDEALEQSRPVIPPQASIPAEETGEFARSTSDNGWPRNLDEETRKDSRPFLAVHLNTENDDIEPVEPETLLEDETPE